MRIQTLIPLLRILFAVLVGMVGVAIIKNQKSSVQYDIS
jgi:hypothetical protein